MYVKKNKSILAISAFIVTLLSCQKSEIVEIKSNSIDSLETATIVSSPMTHPLLVWSQNTQPNPLITPPAIFYSPHQDDETISMAASISEHVRAGRPVYVVLLTNGANAGLLSYIKKHYNSSATMEDVITARNNEFIAACIALGAHRVYIANMGSGYTEAQCYGKNAATGLLNLTQQFKNSMSYFISLYPLISHKTVSGNTDSYHTGCEKTPAHIAATNALHELYSAGLTNDVRFYRVYCYYWFPSKNFGGCDRCSSWFKPIAPVDKLKKQAATAQYKLVDPANHRYGFGNYSFELLNNSLSHPYEYVDFVENDY